MAKNKMAQQGWDILPKKQKGWEKEFEKGLLEFMNEFWIKREIWMALMFADDFDVPIETAYFWLAVKEYQLSKSKEFKGVVRQIRSRARLLGIEEGEKNMEKSVDEFKKLLVRVAGKSLCLKCHKNFNNQLKNEIKKYA